MDHQSPDIIILIHRHLDHVANVKIMIEAMTEAGSQKHSIHYAPADALDDDPDVLHYLRHYVKDIVAFKEGGTYHIEDIIMETPIKHIHGVETY